MTGTTDEGAGRPAHVCPTRSIAGRCRCRGGPGSLKPSYAKARADSLAKCREAIESLEAGPTPQRVSLDSIHVRSVEICKERGEPGIAVTTILGDPACAALYYARRTKNPLSTPPATAGTRGVVGRSKRALSRDLRRSKAENVRLRKDIASIGARRARSDRARVDGADAEDDGEL